MRVSIGWGSRSPKTSTSRSARPKRMQISWRWVRSMTTMRSAARAADLIVVMDLTQRHEICIRFGRAERDVLVLGDLDPQPIETRMIRDPVRQPLAVFEQTYARIERCVRELKRAITAVRPEA